MKDSKIKLTLHGRKTLNCKYFKHYKFLEKQSLKKFKNRGSPFVKIVFRYFSQFNSWYYSFTRLLEKLSKHYTECIRVDPSQQKIHVQSKVPIQKKIIDILLAVNMVSDKKITSQNGEFQLQKIIHEICLELHVESKTAMNRRNVI